MNLKTILYSNSLLFANSNAMYIPTILNTHTSTKKQYGILKFTSKTHKKTNKKK